MNSPTKLSSHTQLFLLPFLILGLHFFIRVIDFGNIIFTYPLYSEAVTQLAQLFFLDSCGFHNFCPYWYNGFTSFLVTPPGWYFFAYPIYLLVGNVLLGSYLSLILMYLLAFLAIFIGGSYLSLSFLQRIFFFFLIFGNNILIKMMSYGRFHEIFAWVMFTFTLLYLLYYKNHPLTKHSLFASLFASLAILSHQSIGVLTIIIFSGLVLSKKGSQRIKALFLIIFPFILSGFWLVQAFLESQRNILSSVKYVSTEAWWNFWLVFPPIVTFTSLAVVALPLVLFLCFYLYTKTTSHKKTEFLFFLPPLVVISLFFIGVVPFLPVLNQIFTNMYMVFMYVLIGFFLIKLSPFFHKKVPYVFPILLVLLALLMVTVNVFGTTLVQDRTSLEDDIIFLGETLDGPYLFMGSFPSSSFPPAYYGYFAIYHDIPTPGGWYPHIAHQEYLEHLSFFKKNEFTCENLFTYINYIQPDYLFGYGERCGVLAACDLLLHRQRNDVCVYEVP